MVIGHRDEVLLLVDEPRRLAVAEPFGNQRQVHADRAYARGGLRPIWRRPLVGCHSGHSASVVVDLYQSLDAAQVDPGQRHRS